MTIQRQCNCESSFQDRTYGKNIRLFNISGKDGKHARCTVCGKTISSVTGDVITKKK